MQTPTEQRKDRNKGGLVKNQESHDGVGETTTVPEEQVRESVGGAQKEKESSESWIGSRHASSSGRLAGDLVVATVLPLALPPIVLVVVHLRALVGVAGIVEGVLETALAALAEA